MLAAKVTNYRDKSDRVGSNDDSEFYLVHTRFNSFDQWISTNEWPTSSQCAMIIKNNFLQFVLINKWYNSMWIKYKIRNLRTNIFFPNTIKKTHPPKNPKRFIFNILQDQLRTINSIDKIFKHVFSYFQNNSYEHIFKDFPVTNVFKGHRLWQCWQTSKNIGGHLMSIREK